MEDGAGGRREKEFEDERRLSCREGNMRGEERRWGREFVMWERERRRVEKGFLIRKGGKGGEKLG